MVLCYYIAVHTFGNDFFAVWVDHVKFLITRGFAELFEIRCQFQRSRGSNMVVYESVNSFRIRTPPLINSRVSIGCKDLITSAILLKHRRFLSEIEVVVGGYEKELPRLLRGRRSLFKPRLHMYTSILVIHSEPDPLRGS
jgi:hypothetical protein